MKEKHIVELAAQMFAQEAHEILASRGPSAEKSAERCLEAASTFFRAAEGKFGKLEEPDTKAN